APGGRVARLAGVVAVHRLGPHRVRLLVAGRPPRQPVTAEVVDRSVDRGDLPVLAVVVAVDGAGELLHPGTVVIGQSPGPVAARHQAAGVPGEHQRAVVERPALVRPAGVAVVGAAAVLALYVPGLVAEPLTDPGGLVVGGGDPPVGALRRVAERDLRG